MTKEEAIELLKEYKVAKVEFPNNLQEQALDMAIKALEQQSSDCVSRQAVLDLATTIQTDDYSGNNILDVIDVDDVKELPPVTPTHGTCKDCKHWDKDDKYCKHLSNEYGWLEDDDYRVDIEEDFYCADFEKRGNEDEVN